MISTSGARDEDENVMIPLGCCSSIVRENPRFTALPTRESESRDLFVAIVVVVVRGKYLDLSESREYIVNFAGVHVTHTGLGFHRQKDT